MPARAKCPTPGVRARVTGTYAWSRPAVPVVQSENTEIREILKQRGPGYPLFHVFSSESDDPGKRATAILAHLAVVLGMVLIGYRHFDNTHTGIAAATLYLLLPYTANYHAADRSRRAGGTAGLGHSIVPPARGGRHSHRAGGGADLVSALSSAAVVFVLLAAGPAPLQPGGARRAGARGGIVGFHAVQPEGTYQYQFCHTFGLMARTTRRTSAVFGRVPWPLSAMPVIAAFVAMCGSMALWPAQKNLGSLLACSAAIMLGTQFWKAYEGGTFMAWYLPLLILTIFRPNLEDRVALSAISEGWVKWRK